MAESDTIAPPSNLTTDDEWKAIGIFPKPDKPYARAKDEPPPIDVGDGHKLYAQEFGNPNGEPVLVIHGGPGGGGNTLYARYFDPKRFRIILYDQRGCGKSTPAANDDFDKAMVGNNTANLVEDIDKVREHFGIKGKMHIEGGSWGTTLALAYAIKHPENVQSLTLRGVFLGQESGAKYVYQGNAATYQEASAPLAPGSTPEQVKAFMEHFNQQGHELEGSYRAFMGDGSQPGQMPAEYRPKLGHMAEAYAKAWDEYVRQIPDKERGDMIQAYVKRSEARPDESKKGTGIFDPKTNTIDPDYQQKLALTWSQWEGVTSQFSHAVGKDGKIDLGMFSDPATAVNLWRLEGSYSANGFYLTDDGSPAPKGSHYIIDHLDNIAKYNIPMFITNGAQDQVCPPRDAKELEKKYKEALVRAGQQHPAQVELLLPEETGHGMTEKGNTKALLELIPQVPHIAPESSPEVHKNTSKTEEQNPGVSATTQQVSVATGGAGLPDVTQAMIGMDKLGPLMMGSIQAPGYDSVSLPPIMAKKTVDAAGSTKANTKDGAGGPK